MIFTHFHVRKSIATILGGSCALAASFFVLGGIETNFFAADAASSPAPSVSASPVTLPPSFTPFYLDRFQEERAALIRAQKDFVEVNFSKDMVMKYEGGVATQEFPIFAKGDPQGWGGTPAGLYEALVMHQVAYSAVSEVYMPYAIKFYGKYYLHGEPYYPWGDKVGAGISGGCIQLQDEIAKTLFELVQKGMPILVVDKENDSYRYERVDSQEMPQVSAASYIIADADSGFVFAEQHSRQSLPIASLTKLMTALVVTENIDLRREVEVRSSMLEAYGVTKELETGESYRVVELLYPLLMPSSNDAAEVLTGFFGRSRTIEMMNEKAKAMFMRDTFFVDPSGLSDGNVASTQDLLYLGRYILNNRPPLFDITKGNDVRSFGGVSFAIDEMKNKNLFEKEPNFLGGKTGYIIAARYTGLFLFRMKTPDNQIRNIVFAVLGSENARKDTQHLSDWLEKSYGLSPSDESNENSILLQH
ncbi:MAG: hypothetical protein A3E07_01160 [Candidatus Wildermuthbacteria bacterium RIFCSPHIGHO2_12_FULL_45_9]|uniref:L,D-TPase catalytic domain-containing protein n=1 Tax=Candidatus Wildermuthbacteria bacterium RIFCSPHIGHO2_02_FULL_45_25 TaxID=1802450 RepID=A0A1G2R1K0_9BACT|nr:MAG: hypothetical protein A2748_00700 [Candidatus Wildermuthbacteria bacterium RIFCSPHIGHO2_01_FULL_45_20]OHA66726.1 MAG: hypothetical protein A3C04_00245 [Candidatus Wildermuthbacteria bacterium RIFCSPHIGHO2_02_FULL_45_25]OHA71480.1 MAG: hypothetical protein A3E07_01160 [Candidatus Wildermuthbacteria bacterium RIFCSPHIGHO2_12_FULL_45_9]